MIEYTVLGVAFVSGFSSAIVVMIIGGIIMVKKGGTKAVTDGLG